jgi:alpha-tubulin suppressor-like RCC1 family protein
MPHEDSACPTDFDNRCSLKPVLVPGLSAVRGVASASDLMCAWTEAGKVHCWGQLANRGLVPTTSTDNTLSPVEIPTLSKVQQLVLSESYGCALSEGKVFCFGWSRYGALGTPQPSQSQPQAPTQVTGLPPIAQLSAWEETTCARTTAGDVYCWGDARFRIVGANATLQKCVSDNDCVPAPVQVAGLKDITAISLSFSHACALTKSKQVWCWGGNFLKGLGIARGPDECADPDGCSVMPLRIW